MAGPGSLFRPVLQTIFATLAGPITEPVSTLDTNISNLVNAVDDPLIASNVTNDSGGVNAYAGTITPGPTVLDATQQGLMVVLKPANTNTGASTFNLNAFGAQAIQRGNGNPLVGGEIIVGQPAILSWTGSGTKWSLINPASVATLDATQSYASGTGTAIAANNTAAAVAVATLLAGSLSAVGHRQIYLVTFKASGGGSGINVTAYFGPNGTTGDTSIGVQQLGTANPQLYLIIIEYLTGTTFNGMFFPLTATGTIAETPGAVFNQTLASSGSFTAALKLTLGQAAVSGTQATYMSIIPLQLA